MNIVISNSGGQPIYEQIARQIKGLILRGELKEGEALPSMRLLAKDLQISVITTKRAYEELESEGFIHTMAGKGCYPARVFRWTRTNSVRWRNFCVGQRQKPKTAVWSWSSWLVCCGSYISN